MMSFFTHYDSHGASSITSICIGDLQFQYERKTTILLGILNIILLSILNISSSEITNPKNEIVTYYLK